MDERITKHNVMHWPGCNLLSGRIVQVQVQVKLVGVDLCLSISLLEGVMMTKEAYSSATRRGKVQDDYIELEETLTRD